METFHLFTMLRCKNKYGSYNIKLAEIPNTKMKFKIFLRKNGHLVQLMNLSCTKNGLYFIPKHSKGNDKDTYHADGNTFFRTAHDKKDGKEYNHILRKKRQPLSNFKDAETIHRGYYTIYAPLPNDPLESETKIKPEDIIFDREGSNFFIEIILSEKRIELEEKAERLNSLVFVKDKIFPNIIVEVFDKHDSLTPGGRYPEKTKYIEGVNLLFGNEGRL